jgi:hypothetical protein
MRPESGHTQPDFLALVRARDYRAETFPHNQLSGRAKREVKRVAWCSVIWLIAGGKFWGHVERRTQYLAGRDCLNSFLIFKGPLLMMVSEPPAWLNAKEWSTIGPQSQIRDAR